MICLHGITAVAFIAAIVLFAVVGIVALIAVILRRWDEWERGL